MHEDTLHPQHANGGYNLPVGIYFCLAFDSVISCGNFDVPKTSVHKRFFHICFFSPTGKRTHSSVTLCYCSGQVPCEADRSLLHADAELFGQALACFVMQS